MNYIGNLNIRLEIKRNERWTDYEARGPTKDIEDFRERLLLRYPPVDYWTLVSPAREHSDGSVSVRASHRNKPH